MRAYRYHIQIRQLAPGRAWYWRVMARNGQAVLTSETYASRDNAKRAARRFAEGILVSKEWSINRRIFE